MKRLYQRYLFFIIATVFIVSFSITFKMQSKIATNQARSTIHYTLEEARDILNQLLDNRKQIMKAHGTEVIAKAQSIAYFLEKNPNYLQSQELLASMIRGNQINQVVIFDENFNITAAYPPLFKNRSAAPNETYDNLKDHKEYKEYYELARMITKYKNTSLFHDLYQEYYNGNSTFLGAASFPNHKGGIVIEQKEQQELESVEPLAITAKQIKNFRFAKIGRLLITDIDGEIICAADHRLLNANLLEKYGMGNWQKVQDGLKLAQKELAQNAAGDQKINLQSGFFNKNNNLYLKSDGNHYLIQYLYLPFEHPKHPTLIKNMEKYEFIDFGENKESAIDWYIIGAAIPQREINAARNTILLQFSIVYIFLFLLAYGITSWLTQKLVINGIYEINSALKKISNGDLKETVNVKSSPEFAMLSEGINFMVNSIKNLSQKHIRQAVENRELNMAGQIQLAAMPNVFPAFPERKDFDIYAVMHSVESVGGDLYDFSLSDSDHLGFTIADVSGKGFSAALLMMKSIVYSRMLITTGISIDQVMARTNNYLKESNNLGMFQTKFIATLELSTGILSYINAAHPTPIIISPTRKTVSLLDSEKNNYLMLGMIKDSNYATRTFMLKPDDRILMFTDGVTEAENTNHECYGYDRLIDLLKNDLQKRKPPKTLLDDILNDIHAFEQGAPSMDDTTLLIIDYFGPDSSDILDVSS